MSWAAERRLDYIDWRLAVHGEVRREHLMTAFGISPPQASADLAAFAAEHPGAMRYDSSRKSYVSRAGRRYRIRRGIQCDADRRLLFTLS